MRVSSKTHYAVQAALVLARRPGEQCTADEISCATGVPVHFLRGAILPDLRRAGLVSSVRGPVGGYRLALEPGRVAVGDVVRAVDGPLASVHGERPQDLVATEGDEVVRELWVAVRAALRLVLDTTTLADLVAGDLPPDVTLLLAQPGVWDNR